MARYTAATWVASPNETPNGMLSYRGLVLHIMQGTEAGTDSWFKNPASQVSAHFGIAKDGTVHQYVDTDDKAWAEVAGNPYWLSCEFEGQSGDTLTDAQVKAAGELYAWVAALYKVPMQPTDSPNGNGLGWHGMGGAAWGGHLDCPGQPIIGQRPAILAAAQPPAPQGGTPVPTPAPGTVYANPWSASNVVSALDCPTGGVWLLTKDGHIYAVNCPLSKDFGGMPAGNSFWAGRTAAELVSVPAGGYTVIDTAGEKYSFTL